MAVEAASIIPIFDFCYKKGLISKKSSLFNVPGGDKRDRTADLLNAIHFRGITCRFNLYQHSTLKSTVFLVKSMGSGASCPESQERQ